MFWLLAHIFRHFDFIVKINIVCKLNFAMLKENYKNNNFNCTVKALRDMCQKSKSLIKQSARVKYEV